MNTNDMTLEELRNRIWDLETKNEDQLIYHSEEKQTLIRERDEWERKFNDIFLARRAIGNAHAIISHLEKELERANAIILSYQNDYKKFGTFYRDYNKNIEQAAMNLVYNPYLDKKFEYKKPLWWGVFVSSLLRDEDKPSLSIHALRRAYGQTV